MSESLKVEHILPGRCYEAKKPEKHHSGFWNDRQVRWVNSDRTKVQYDGPTVANGRHFPTIEMDKFLKWVGRDVTALMPDGEWRPWL